MIHKKYFYLASFCIIFLFLAMSYKHSDSIFKQFQDDIVTSGTKLGVYKGDQAEDFQLINEKGETVKLSDYKGKKVFLNFFASWCGPCQEEMPILVELNNRTNDEELVILAINVTTQETNPNNVRQFINHYKIDFPVLFDGDGKVMKTYQLVGIPTSLFIDGKGKIVDRLNGIVTIEMIETHPFFKGVVN